MFNNSIVTKSSTIYKFLIELEITLISQHLKFII